MLKQLTHIFPLLLLFFGCDDCNRIDDPPPTYENWPCEFKLIQEDPFHYLVKLSPDDSNGLYLPENIDFLNENGISVKDSIFFIQDREIIYQPNPGVINNNLLQDFRIVFSADHFLDITVEHQESFSECLGRRISDIYLIVRDEIFSLISGASVVIYL